MTPRWITNFTDALKSLLTVPTVYIDGALYAGAAIFGFAQGFLSGEEAYKYVTPPSVLFWIKLIVGCAAAGCLALKMFRSTTFAEHQQEKSDATTGIIRTETVTQTEPPKTT